MDTALQTIPHRTLVILKPECIENCIVGGVMTYFDKVGLRPIAMRVHVGDSYKFRVHYARVISEVGPDIGNDIIKRMTRGPCVFIVYESNGNAVIAARSQVGATNPALADPDTIRGHYGGSVQYNTVHASDSAESAEREIAIWFPECMPSNVCYTQIQPGVTGC
jgi:nucleoside-diphosphate kinase